MRLQTLLGRALSFCLSAGLGFGALSLIGVEPANGLVSVNVPSSHDLHAALGGDHSGKLIAVGDGRPEVGRFEPLQFQLENHFDRRARVAYAVELVDELGESMMRPSTSANHVLEPDETRTFEIPAPKGLGDGFYLFRITAAGRSGQELADTTVEMGFFLSGNSMQLLSDEDWLQISYANEGEQQ